MESFSSAMLLTTTDPKLTTEGSKIDTASEQYTVIIGDHSTYDNSTELLWRECFLTLGSYNSFLSFSRTHRNKLLSFEHTVIIIIKSSKHA